MPLLLLILTVLGVEEIVQAVEVFGYAPQRFIVEDLRRTSYQHEAALRNLFPVEVVTLQK